MIDRTDGNTIAGAKGGGEGEKDDQPEMPHLATITSTPRLWRR
jgi:hypothetical protein